jgi:predicted component of viral defense system (DUF524 family)
LAATTIVRALPGEILFEVVEGGEYRFEWSGDPQSVDCLTDPEEMFEVDDPTGRTGRLRPRLFTGTVDAVFRAEGVPLAAFAFEVRSKKLDYKSEYQWMLRDVAEHMTELVMHRFAASRMSFVVDERRDAETLYEQFEFLRAALQGDRLKQAFGRIVHAPHVKWQVRAELAPASLGVRSSADIAKRLTGAGPRIATVINGRNFSVPQLVLARRTESTTDTPVNRFVRYALEHWIGVMWRLADVLSKKSDSAIVLRARREVSNLIGELDELARVPLLSNVGRLNHFPAGDQVLQKREGYRDFYKTFIEFELAAMLTWRRQTDGYRAGQRDVAELYEFWVFLQLGLLVGELVGKPFFLGPLLRATEDGLNISLRSGAETVLEGELTHNARRLRISLFFNKTFDAKPPERLSWTRPMRPDVTLTITPVDEHGLDADPTHVHFDAKYRVQALEELFGDPAELANTDIWQHTKSSPTAKRDDLLKMHAYRDAIAKTAGAYVLYPGRDLKGQEFREFEDFHELLPGLGAFVLRPSVGGPAAGSDALGRFLRRVFDAVAQRFSRHERSRHWLGEVYRPNGAGVEKYEAPPTQASVLLGFVKSAEHWAWIQRNRTYNVRAAPRHGGVAKDSILLQSQLLLLYCPASGAMDLYRIVGRAELVGADAMNRTEYPFAQGKYWCVQISEMGQPDWTEGLSASDLERFVLAREAARGMPSLVTWQDLSALRHK